MRKKTLKMRRYRNGSKGQALLGALFVIIMVFGYLTAAVIRSNSDMHQAEFRKYSQEAFYAADSGVQWALFNFRRDPSWGWTTESGVQTFDINVAAENFSYPVEDWDCRVSVDDGGAWRGWTRTRLVTSVGRDPGRNVNRTVVARIVVENPARFLVSTLGDLILENGADIHAPILAQNIIFRGPDIDFIDHDVLGIEAKAYYFNAVFGADSTGTPYYSVSDVEETDPIVFSSVDEQYFRTLANDVRLGGMVEYSALPEKHMTLQNYSEGFSGEGAGLIFSEGDVYVQGRYDHSMMVVAKGDIHIAGSLDAQLPDSGPAPQLALFSRGDILIDDGAVDAEGNLTIEAMLVADGQEDGGDGRSYGGVVRALAENNVFNHLNFFGTIAARGEGTEGDSSAVTLSAFRTRSYTFNPALSQDNTLPFNIPHFVNILSWERQ
ncbi:MAG: hypothetical protein ACLFPX_02045 [Candidatus Omnitrophota bacterium]